VHDDGALVRFSEVRAEHQSEVSSVPDEIVLRRDRDLAGRRHEIWVRRGFLALFAVVPVLALFNVFGAHRR